MTTSPWQPCTANDSVATSKKAIKAPGSITTQLLQAFRSRSRRKGTGVSVGGRTGCEEEAARRRWWRRRRRRRRRMLHQTEVKLMDKRNDFRDEARTAKVI